MVTFPNKRNQMVDQGQSLSNLEGQIESYLAEISSDKLLKNRYYRLSYGISIAIIGIIVIVIVVVIRHFI